MSTVAESPELIYDPDPEQIEHARVRTYIDWLDRTRGIRISSWEELQQWSVTELEAFWETVWLYFDVKAHTPYSDTLIERSMPGTSWFPGATINYAEHCFGAAEDVTTTAVIAYSPDPRARHADLRRADRAGRPGPCRASAPRRRTRRPGRGGTCPTLLRR